MHERLIKHITEEDPDKKREKSNRYILHTYTCTYCQTLEQWDRVQSRQEIAFIFNEKEKKRIPKQKNIAHIVIKNVFACVPIYHDADVIKAR